MSLRKLSVQCFCVGALVIQGCASSSVDFMVPATVVPEPDGDSAVVTFLRPSTFAFAIKFGIWDSEELVGVLSAKSSITTKVKPGEHVFLGRAENWAVVKADVQAGKHYYILVRPRMGMLKAGVIMDPIKADTAEAQLQEWLEKANPKQLDAARNEAYVTERLPHIQRALENVANGEAEFNVMGPDDAR